MEQLSERLREEFSKSMSVESSTSALPSQKNASSNKSASDAKNKKLPLTPPTKQPSSSQHPTPSTVGQPAGSRGATNSSIEKSESTSKLNSSLQKSINNLKPLVKPKPLIPSTAAAAVESESDEAVYQNWTSQPEEEEEEEEESGRKYENWTTGEGAPDGSLHEQIYENTTKRPPQKPMGKR